jgi:hypothetical protein
VSSYVNFELLARVLLYSLLAGLVVTGAFALGARSLANADGARAAARPARIPFVIAIACFSISAVAAVSGIWFVLDKH